MKPELTHYAVVQIGYAIFGVGETPDEAQDDAREWLDDPCDDMDEDSQIIGNLATVECTKKLHDYVVKNGTTTWSCIDGNELNGICMPDEIEE